MDKERTGVLLVWMLAALLVTGSVVYAQGGSGYDLTWWTVDGGGGTLSQGGYTLSGTSGQPDAGLLNSGDYTLMGGFWGTGGAITVTTYRIHLPIVLRNR